MNREEGDGEEEWIVRADGAQINRLTWADDGRITIVLLWSVCQLQRCETQCRFEICHVLLFK